MSTVCYCGQPDCPVTTWERDACVTNLRAERDALLAERDELRAQVDAARAYAHKTLANDEECDPFRLLRVMDEARTKRAVNSLTVERGPKGGAA